MEHFAWNEDTVRYMRAAVLHTDFYRTLAGVMAPHLDRNGTLLDAGAGLGALSATLAPLVSAVTAVEKDPLAFAAMREYLAWQNAAAVTPLLLDAGALPGGMIFDSAVFCYYGMPEEILEIAKAHCRGRVFVVKRANRFHRFSMEKIPVSGDSLEACRLLLEKRGIPYRETLFSADMGQPFAGMDDARRFFRLFSRDEADDSRIRSRLIETDDPEYPLRCPMVKEAGCLIFRSEDI